MSSRNSGSGRSAARKLILAPVLVAATAVASLSADAAAPPKPPTAPNPIAAAASIVGQAHASNGLSQSPVLNSDSTGTGRKIR